MKNNYEQDLIHQLRLKGKLELAEVVERLQISESTARRLFTRLEKEGKVIRVHGGIQIPGKHPTEYSFERLAKDNLQEKTAIACKACDMLTDGDVIFCDTGTTVFFFCMELLRRMENHSLKVKVYTNSLANFEILSSKVPVTLIGGEYRSHRKDFAGYLAETALEKVHFTKCFLGADGCDQKKFFTTTDFDTARLDQIAMTNSEETIILCTADKFLSYAQVGYAEFSDVNYVITDTGIGEKNKKKLQDAGMQVIVAG